LAQFYNPLLQREAKKALQLLRSKTSFLITSHIGIDGDGLASELALARVLKRMGKRVQILNDSGTPHVYEFLPGVKKIERYPQVSPRGHEVTVILDAGKFERVGSLKEEISLSRDTVINIDHHRSNKGFGTVSLIDPLISSVGESLFEFFKWAKLKIDKTTALLLYVAILTDTGRFTYDNTTARTHRNIGELLEYRIRPEVVANEIYRRLTRGQVELLRRALGTLSYTEDGKVAHITLLRKDFDQTAMSALETQEFVEIPRSIDGVRVGIYFRETRETGTVKVSMRSNGGIDLNSFARRFGGGGHKSASGITLHTTIDDAKRKILASLSKAIRGTASKKLS
jgi:phosphoesterase RecJ-like protein